MIKVPNFFSNRLTWMSVALIALYLLASKIYPENVLAEFARTAVSAVAFCACIGYITEAVNAYRAHVWPNKPLLAALANCLLFGGLFLGGMFQTLWRMSNFQNYVVTNDYYTFTILMMAVGIFILVALPNFVGPGVSTRTRWTFITLWTLAGGSVIILSLASPDLLWLAEWLKPWLKPSLTICPAH
jgi:hypothetical protein